MNYNDQTAVAGWTCANCSEFVLMNRSHTCPTVMSESGWTTIIPTLKEYREGALKAALLSFKQKLAEYQIQMPPEFTELVSKHFWELV